MDEMEQATGAKPPSDTAKATLGTRRGTMTTHACLSCRDKRTKCDGQRPCDRCRRRKVECHYVDKQWQSKGGLRQETEDLRRHLHKREVILQALASQPDPYEILQKLRSGDSIDAIFDALMAQHGNSSRIDMTGLEMALQPFDESSRMRADGAGDILEAGDRLAPFTSTDGLVLDSPGTASSHSTGSSMPSGYGSQPENQRSQMHNLTPNFDPGSFSMQLTVDQADEWPPTCSADTDHGRFQYGQLPSDTVYPMSWPSLDNSEFENMPPM